jgi:hypothetical protein
MILFSVKFVLIPLSYRVHRALPDTFSMEFNVLRNALVENMAI